MTDTPDTTQANIPPDTSDPDTRRRKLPLRTKLAFSSGGLQEATVGAAGITTMIFYNQVLGLPAGLCGIAFMVASIVDGISDPLVGAISDRFDSRWGRRHPFMFLSAFPLGVSFYLLYQPLGGLGQTGTFIWLIACMVLMRLAYTFYNIPHDALGAELTDDYHERTSLFGYNSVIGSGLTVGMALFVLMVLFPTTAEYDNGLLNESRYLLMAITGALIVVGAVLLCTLGTADQIPYLHRIKRESIKVKTYFRELLQLIVNPSYVSVCVSWLTIAAGSAILGMVSTYTYIYAYALSTEAMAIAGFAKLPGIAVALPLATFMTRWLDKKQTVITISLLSAGFIGLPHILRMLGWFPGNDSPFLLWMLFGPMFLGFMIMPVVAIVVDSQLVDIADDHELKTGRRSEGVVFSVRTFAMKATAGLGGMIGGFALEIIGFPQDAKVGELAESTVNGLLIINGPLYIGIYALGVLFMAMYRLNEERHQEILTALAERRGENPGS